MAVRIVFAIGLDNKTTTYLLSALQDIGAEAVCEGEWHFKQRALTANELRTQLREGLDRNADLADKLVIEVLRSETNLNPPIPKFSISSN